MVLQISRHREVIEESENKTFKAKAKVRFLLLI